MLSMFFGHNSSLGLCLQEMSYIAFIKFLFEVQTQAKTFYFKFALTFLLNPWLCTYHGLTILSGHLLPLHPFPALQILLTVWGQTPKDPCSWMVVCCPGAESFYFYFLTNFYSLTIYLWNLSLCISFPGEVNFPYPLLLPP